MCVLHRKYAYFWNKPILRTDISFLITFQSAHTCVFDIRNMCIYETNKFFEQTFRSLLPCSRFTDVCFTQEICVFLKQTNSSNRRFVHYSPPIGSQMRVLDRKYVYFWNKPILRTDFSFIITLQSARRCLCLHWKSLYFWNKPILRTDLSFIITLQSARTNSSSSLLPSQSAHICVFYIGNLYFWNKPILRTDFPFIITLQSARRCVLYIGNIYVCLKQTNSSNRLSVHYYPPVGSQMCVLHRKYVYLWNKPILRTDVSFIITLRSAHRCVFYIRHMYISEKKQFFGQTFRSLLPSSRFTDVCFT